jgi:FkbM family methyltransferase
MSEIHDGANSFFQMARKLQQEGKLEEAIALYQEAINKNPNFSWYYHNLGDILTAVGDYKEALTTFSQAVKLSPNSAYFHYKLGLANTRLGYEDRAVTSLETALKLSPDNTQFKKIFKDIIDNNKQTSLSMKNEYDFIQYVEKGIIHVGANTGQESEIYGDAYNVLWIEPIEEVFKILCDNVKHFQRHKCLCCLIGEKDNQEFSFYIANQTARSSMHEFTNHHYNDPQFKYEVVQIKARRLDNLIEEGVIDIDLYDVLVTDCQGGDYGVIVSLAEKIKEFKIVKTEVMIKEIYKSTVLENDVNSYMNSVGFDLVSNFDYHVKATQRDNIYWNRRFNYPSPITE